MRFQQVDLEDAIRRAQSALLNLQRPEGYFAIDPA